jgi:DNA gyrase subunit A
VVTEAGMGKRTGVEAYRLQRRGGKGVINIRTKDKTGKVVAIREVHPDDELMLITRSGIINRQPVSGIRVIGRNTQGVRLINLDKGDRVMDVARVVNEDDEPAPIPTGPAEPGDAAQEMVPDAALEEELGVGGDEDDELDDGDVLPDDDILDEVEPDDEDEPV